MSGYFIVTVVGVEEDKFYTENCKKIISSFGANIRVSFKGGVPNHELPGIFVDHHIFALPTKGENFGHAIFEALAHGKPVLISDQTPWRNLSDQKAGWDLPLNEPMLFKDVLAQVVEMDQEQYNAWSESAWQFARNFIQQSNIATAYKKLFG